VCGGGTTILHSIYQKIIRVENLKLMIISQHLHNVIKELKVWNVKGGLEFVTGVFLCGRNKITLGYLFLNVQYICTN